MATEMEHEMEIVFIEIHEVKSKLQVSPLISQKIKWKRTWK